MPFIILTLEKNLSLKNEPVDNRRIIRIKVTIHPPADENEIEGP